MSMFDKVKEQVEKATDELSSVAGKMKKEVKFIQAFFSVGDHAKIEKYADDLLLKWKEVDIQGVTLALDKTIIVVFKVSK